MYTSKAAKTREITQLNNIFYKIMCSIGDSILDYRDNMHLYYERPTYIHHWNEKKSNMFRPYFPAEVEEIENLVNMVKEIKEAPICKPEPKNKLEIAITKDIKQQLETAKKQYARGIRLTKFFGKLDVTCNSHLVSNFKGTTFVRTFYYLYGKLTALNIIIAVAEKQKEDMK